MEKTESDIHCECSMSLYEVVHGIEKYDQTNTN